MREDFSKVLVERERGGMRVRIVAPHASQVALRDEPERFRAFESSSRARGGTKHLSENLGPLVRFLRGAVGRPWNDVHRELSTHVSRSNAVQAHIFAHLYQYVALRVRWVDGHVVDEFGSRWSPWRDRFYVCPRTHRLCIWPYEPRKVRRFRAGPSRPQRVIDPWHVHRCVDGIWYAVTLARVPGEARAVCDVEAGEVQLPRGLSALSDLYGYRNVYGVARRSVNSRTIRRLGLRELEASFTRDA